MDPRPSFPLPPEPKQRTDRGDARSRHACSPPAATWMTGMRCDASNKDVALKMCCNRSVTCCFAQSGFCPSDSTEPVPSWPLLASPAHSISPSASTKQECATPAETCCTLPPKSHLASGVTCPGLCPNLSLLPEPSFPLPLSPKQRLDPSLRTMHVWRCPAET